MHLILSSYSIGTRVRTYKRFNSTIHCEQLVRWSNFQICVVFFFFFVFYFRNPPNGRRSCNLGFHFERSKDIVLLKSTSLLWKDDALDRFVFHIPRKVYCAKVISFYLSVLSRPYLYSKLILLFVINKSFVDRIFKFFLFPTAKSFPLS